MHTDWNLRSATAKDAPFLTTIICWAEAAGGIRTTYEALFELSRGELETMLQELVAEDIPGCELCFPAFVIAEHKGQAVAACAAWVEGDGNQASNFLKAQMLCYALGPSRWKAAARRMETLSKVELPRIAGSFQLDAFGVLPEYRGQGLVQDLIEGQLERNRQLGPQPTHLLAQIQLVRGNAPAIRAYQKAGFEPSRERWTDDPGVHSILGSNGKLLLEKAL
jgi:GNAT superfamily N-acetyltransferase